MSIILAIETSTLRASVAVLSGEKLVSARMGGVNTHSEEIMHLIDGCLSDASLTVNDVSHLALGRGPGSFTGLRIGMSTMKGLAYALDCPIVDVSSLEAVASEMLRAKRDPEAIYVPILDARRDEIFVACYRLNDSDFEAISEERVMAPENLEATLAAINPKGKTLYLAGNGLTPFPELGSHGSVMESVDGIPNATSIARLALNRQAKANWQSLGPTYIRKSEAEIKFPDGNPGGAFSPPKRS